MNTKGKSKLTLVILAFMWVLCVPLTVSAAGVAGQLDSVSSKNITGWACDYSKINESVMVELELVSQDSNEIVKTFTVPANQKRGDSTDNLGQTGHGFKCSISWSEFAEGYYDIRAFILSNGERIKISDDKHSTVLSSDFQFGPGITEKSISLTSKSEAGKSLGMFRTTGYCNCSICSEGNNLTYSGTVPKANHTIAADLNVLPVGTKVFMNGIIYTVEDKGSNVTGNKIDIYYDDHSKATAHGVKNIEVFLVE